LIENVIALVGNGVVAVKSHSPLPELIANIGKMSVPGKSKEEFFTQGDKHEFFGSDH
jgi:hypothetical protein